MLDQPQAPREATPPPGDIAHTGVGETPTGTGDPPTDTREPNTNDSRTPVSPTPLGTPIVNRGITVSVGRNTSVSENPSLVTTTPSDASIASNGTPFVTATPQDVSIAGNGTPFVTATPQDTSIASNGTRETAVTPVEERPTVALGQGASNGGQDETSLVATMKQLLMAHTEAIAAQTQATAAQHLPPLKPYTGEGKQVEEDGCERWIEQFEERAKIAGWNTAQQLHQLKLLLEKTALRVFRMLPDVDRNSYEQVVKALRSRFKAVDIEELCGLEFHHRVQVDETIEELGLELQSLGRKAFPSITGREFDRLLKGRFFQALHVKWQRKLAAPKTGETFQEFYDRARVLEQHEKQYAESAASRDGTRKNDRKGTGRDRPPPPPRED